MRVERLNRWVGVGEGDEVGWVDYDSIGLWVSNWFKDKLSGSVVIKFGYFFHVVGNFVQPQLKCGFCGMLGNSTRYCRNTPHYPKCGGPHLASACKLERVRGLEECHGVGMEYKEIENLQPPRKTRGSIFLSSLQVGQLNLRRSVVAFDVITESIECGNVDVRML